MENKDSLSTAEFKLWTEIPQEMIQGIEVESIHQFDVVLVTHEGKKKLKFPYMRPVILGTSKSDMMINGRYVDEKGNQYRALSKTQFVSIYKCYDAIGIPKILILTGSISPINKCDHLFISESDSGFSDNSYAKCQKCGYRP